MSRRAFTIVLSTALMLVMALAAAGPAQAAPSKAKAKERAKHARIVDYWTPTRMANAVPRDFVKTKRGFKPAKRGNKPPKGPGGGDSGGSGGLTTGATWTTSGQARQSTGKVFFTMGGVNYVCSGAAVKDPAANRSLVLTAGHCVFDETNDTFATRWLFIPEYAAKRTTNCRRTPHGCYTATGLVVDEDYASAGGFNQKAIEHDWGFAILGEGSKGGQLDARVTPYPIRFDAPSSTMYSFGYPATSPYNGRELIYCAGRIIEDGRSANATWGLPCTMTGGASGGPWLKGFDAATQKGHLNSVNSYKWNDQPGFMYGPKFNAETSATYDAAATITDSTATRVRFDWDPSAR